MTAVEVPWAFTVPFRVAPVAVIPVVVPTVAVGAAATVNVPLLLDTTGLLSCGVPVQVELSQRCACSTTLPLADPAVICALKETVLGLPPGSSRQLFSTFRDAPVGKVFAVNFTQTVEFWLPSVTTIPV